MEDGGTYFIRHIGNDIDARRLVALMHRIDDLRRYKLEDDGVKRLIPSEQETGNDQHHRIAGKNVVPGRRIEADRKIDGDEVGAAGTCVVAQRDADGKAVDDTAEYRHQQQIAGDFRPGQNSRKQGCQCIEQDRE